MSLVFILSAVIGYFFYDLSGTNALLMIAIAELISINNSLRYEEVKEY